MLPALIAGNTVLLKPSPQTPLTAERLALALTRAGVPADAVQVLHLGLEQAAAVAADARVGFASFTGSVKGGRDVERAVAGGKGFAGVALEVSFRIVWGVGGCADLVCGVAWRQGPRLCARGRGFGLYGWGNR